MQDRAQSFIDQASLFGKEDKLLLAVSGGIDSIVLLNVLHKLGYQIEVAHMNFGLRGDDSDNDERLVKEVSQSLDLVCHIKKVDLQKEKFGSGYSTQMAARSLRYKWFEELRENRDLKYIVTAHHANDNLETVLFNLTKGTGIRGLRGMNAKEGNRVKPLLIFTKEELLSYAKSNGLKWNEDASNEEDDYSRNKIRHHVIPELQVINPNLLKTYRQTQKRLLGVEEVLNNKVQSVRQNHLKSISHVEYLSLEWLEKTKESLLILSEILTEFGFSFSMSEQVFQATFSHAGKIFKSDTHTLNIDRAKLLIQTNQNPVFHELEIEEEEGVYAYGEHTLKMTFFKENPIFDGGENVAYLDFDLLTFPLVMRTWRAGDAFKPLGMHGKKKVSDFLVDRKVPRLLKEKVQILCSGEHICWLVGFRLDDRFKVTESTKRIVRLEYMTDGYEG